MPLRTGALPPAKPGTPSPVRRQPERTIPPEAGGVPLRTGALPPAKPGAPSPVGRQQSPVRTQPHAPIQAATGRPDTVNALPLRT